MWILWDALIQSWVIKTTPQEKIKNTTSVSPHSQESLLALSLNEMNKIASKKEIIGVFEDEWSVNFISKWEFDWFTFFAVFSDQNQFCYSNTLRKQKTDQWYMYLIWIEKEPVVIWECKEGDFFILWKKIYASSKERKNDYLAWKATEKKFNEIIEQLMLEMKKNNELNPKLAWIIKKINLITNITPNPLGDKENNEKYNNNYRIEKEWEDELFTPITYIQKKYIYQHYRNPKEVKDTEIEDELHMNFYWREWETSCILLDYHAYLNGEEKVISNAEIHPTALDWIESIKILKNTIAKYQRGTFINYFINGDVQEYYTSVEKINDEIEWLQKNFK
jgi:hypothetical protein